LLVAEAVLSKAKANEEPSARQQEQRKGRSFGHPPAPEADRSLCG